MLIWQWSQFDELKLSDLYAAMQARLEVFCVEQNCPYQDADGLDPLAWHLIGRDQETQAIAAYCRVIAPGARYAEPSIGRVLTTRTYRRNGSGRALMSEALARTAAVYPGQAIRIGAQCHLEEFYRGFGFRTVSAPYDEDGIPHVEMLRNA